MFTRVIALGAFVATAVAQSTSLSFTSVPSSMTVGNQYTIGYLSQDTNTQDAILIQLRQGPSDNLAVVSTLTSAAPFTPGTTEDFVFTPDCSLKTGSDYALSISQGTQVNYFGPFVITANTTCAPASSSMVSSSSSVKLSSTTTLNVTTTITTAHHNTTTASGSIVTVAANTTFSSATLTATSLTNTVKATSASSTKTSASASATSSNGAQREGSNLALVLGVVAGLAYLG